MADPSSIGEAAKSIGDLIAGFVPEGPLRTAVFVVYGLCAAIAPFIFAYYLKLLAHGGAEEGSIERQDYDGLRASLAGDNLAARLYAKWLTKFLDRIEHFFGDVGMADRTLFPHAFGRKTPVPLWTAPAFDRCLLLALLYPIAAIFLIWAISGHVGPAETALGLEPNLPGWLRGLIVMASFGFASFAIWRRFRAPGWKTLAVIMIIVALAFAVASHLEGADLIKKLDPDKVGPEASQIQALEKGRAEALAGELKNLVCSGDESALYILRGLTSALPGLTKSILAPDCPVSAALTDADNAALKKLASPTARTLAVVAFAVAFAVAVASAIPGAGAVAIAFVLGARRLTAALALDSRRQRGTGVSRRLSSLAKCSRALCLASRPRRSSPGVSFSISCPPSASTCFGSAKNSPTSICPQNSFTSPTSFANTGSSTILDYSLIFFHGALMRSQAASLASSRPNRQYAPRTDRAIAAQRLARRP